MSKSSMRGVAVGIVCWALLWGAGPGRADEHEKGFQLDHFKVYAVESVEAGASVKLWGQFDRMAKPAALRKITHFANPVSKNGEGVRNRVAHLVWYAIEQREEEREREIVVRNQFGEQRLRIGKPRFLLAPAEKRERESAPPYGLDHFKCYEVLEGRPADREVELRDQFVEDSTPVGEPKLFCVPVRKYFRDGWEPIKNARDHLTFYEIEPEPFEKRVWAIDQFGQRELFIGPREMLGVPSLKRLPERDRCVRFETLPLGATFVVPDTFVDAGVTMEAEPFQWSNAIFTDKGFARVENHALAGGSGQDLQVNNITIEFLFGTIGGVVLKFGEYGGNLNITVNGDFKNFQDFADINGAALGGTVVTVTNGLGNDKGTLFLDGRITKFSVGGQELWIDDVCPVVER